MASSYCFINRKLLQFAWGDNFLWVSLIAWPERQSQEKHIKGRQRGKDEGTSLNNIICNNVQRQVTFFYRGRVFNQGRGLHWGIKNLIQCFFIYKWNYHRNKNESQIENSVVALKASSPLNMQAVEGKGFSLPIHMLIKPNFLSSHEYLHTLNSRENPIQSENIPRNSDVQAIWPTSLYLGEIYTFGCSVV